jgi:hypothetical protein
MKEWQVYSSRDGVNWHKESGWIVSGRDKADAIRRAKDDQSRGGGIGALDVDELPNQDAYFDDPIRGERRC